MKSNDSIDECKQIKNTSPAVERNAQKCRLTHNCVWVTHHMTRPASHLASENLLRSPARSWLRLLLNHTCTFLSVQLVFLHRVLTSAWDTRRKLLPVAFLKHSAGTSTQRRGLIPEEQVYRPVMELGSFGRSNFPGAGLPPVWVVSCPWSPTHPPAGSPQTCSSSNASHWDQSTSADAATLTPTNPSPCAVKARLLWNNIPPGSGTNRLSTRANPTSQRRIWRAAGTGRKAARRKGEWPWRRRGRRRPPGRPRRRPPAATDGPTTASRRAFATWCWNTQKWC